MAPSSQLQSRLIAGLYERERIDVSRIAYLETHGTGTPLGDPIELEGLRSAFRKAGGEGCHLGAVKPLIGHTLVASGLASVVKALLAFHHETIPPVAATGDAVSYLDVAPFRVNREPLPWPRDKPLCAISAFGFTGSNGHVILRKLPDGPTGQDAVDRRPGRALPFCLSAASRDSLATLAGRTRALVAEAAGRPALGPLPAAAAPPAPPARAGGGGPYPGRTPHRPRRVGTDRPGRPGAPCRGYRPS